MCPMGFWTKANPEPCLLVTRGKPKRRSADIRKAGYADRSACGAEPVTAKVLEKVPDEAD